jgi:hypothetical protein
MTSNSVKQSSAFIGVSKGPSCLAGRLDWSRVVSLVTGFSVGDSMIGGRSRRLAGAT